MSKERFKRGQSRYITRGISERLPPEIQIILWRMVESLKNEIKLDYLQVFRLETLGSLEDDSLVQVIIHEQEKPQYSRRYYFPDLRIGVTGKVYIIDDGEHSTMLWAEEY